MEDFTLQFLGQLFHGAYTSSCELAFRNGMHICSTHELVVDIFVQLQQSQAEIPGE